jgi:hypothetical protein
VITPEKREAWQQPLFAPNIPVEIILRIAHLILHPEDVPSPEQAAQDLTIYRMLAMDVFERGADFREVPWTLRLEHARLTGKAEQQPLRRPKGPEPL